ncbi:pseudouridine synthase [Haliscomenobacter sp.]|uniref:pseudouridine synthase n=1 Tax=Haliscomenobacter sp. TaxID=2717303 RepID=UPI003364C086
MKEAFHYFLLNKPFGYLSQFTPETPGQLTLADLGPFPPDVYPVGRLDQDSEGLLLLSNDSLLNIKLLDPRHAHWRTYWVQVEGVPTVAALQQLRNGVDIRINKKTHHTLPARAKSLTLEAPIPERNPPIRFRANIPTTWIEISLQEGKNRQVRRMCAKVGFPVLRLLRVQIEELALGDLPVGAIKECTRSEIYALLKL